MNGYKTIFIVSAVVLCTSHVANSFSYAKVKSDDNPCPPDFSGLLPNPEDCKSFYICDNGFPGLFPCPANLCFNPAVDSCDHCADVPGCEPGSSTRPPTNPTTSQAPNATTSEPPNTSSEPSSEGTTATQAPTTTSSVTTTTEAPSTSEAPTTTSRATTTTEGTTPNPTTTTTQRSTTSNGEDLPCPSDPYIYQPYPGDCNMFYYCQDGVNTGVYKCGSGLWFNVELQACVVPWGSSCE